MSSEWFYNYCMGVASNTTTTPLPIPDSVNENINSMLPPLPQAGPIEKVHFPSDPKTGWHKNYGFVEFEDLESVSYSIQLLNGISLFGRPMRVNTSSKSSGSSEVVAGLPTLMEGVPPPKDAVTSLNEAQHQSQDIANSSCPPPPPPRGLLTLVAPKESEHLTLGQRLTPSNTFSEKSQHLRETDEETGAVKVKERNIQFNDQNNNFPLVTSRNSPRHNPFTSTTTTPIPLFPRHSMEERQEIQGTMHSTAPHKQFNPFSQDMPPLCMDNPHLQDVPQYMSDSRSREISYAYSNGPENPRSRELSPYTYPNDPDSPSLRDVSPYGYPNGIEYPFLPSSRDIPSYRTGTDDDYSDSYTTAEEHSSQLNNSPFSLTSGTSGHSVNGISNERYPPSLDNDRHQYHRNRIVHMEDKPSWVSKETKVNLRDYHLHQLGETLSKYKELFSKQKCLGK